MNESLSSTSRTTEHIEVMQNLLMEILNIQKENMDVEKGMQRVQEIIVESSRFVENSTSTNEMIVDAKILHTGTSVFNNTVSSLNTNLTSFSFAKYISGIHSYIDTSEQIVLVGREWECLAPVTYHMFKKSHPVSFMLGALSLEPVQRKEKAKGEKQKRTPEPKKTCLTTITEKSSNAEEEKEGSDVYDHILKWLVRHYRKNEKQPINYFNFIIDPFNYWKTIENIFHFAFLVRDGSVKMLLVNGLPYVEPVMRGPEDKSHKETSNYQFCFSLSMAEWVKCIQKFGITAPSIPPFVNQSSN